MEHEQQSALERFFREEGAWYPDYYAFYVVAVIFLGLAGMIYIAPFQIWEGDYQVILIVFFMELTGMDMYLRRYWQFREDGKSKNIYELLRYLPVSRRQFALYRLGKLMKLCLRMTGITAVCQTVSALAFLHTFSLGNLLIPLVCSLILPMLLLGGSIAVSRN